MKKILTIYILFQLCYSVTNAQIKVVGNLTTNGVASYPTHIDSLGKGGFMVMPDIAGRNAIPSLRRKRGMLVYVQSVDSLYKLNTNNSNKLTSNSDWLTIGLSSDQEVNRFLRYGLTYDSLHIMANTVVDSNLEVKGNLILNTGLQFNDSLIVTKGARVQQGMKIMGKLDLRDSLVVNRISILNDSLFVKGISVLSKIKFDSTLLNRSLVDSADSLNNRKVNIRDTSNMLLPYLRKTDTANMMSNSLRISDSATMLSNRLRISDSSTMLLPYLRKTDTANMMSNSLRISDSATMLSNRLRISDSSTMLLPYLRKTDTANMMSNSLRISDTATMLSPYLRSTDTANMLSTRFQRDTASLSNRIDTLASRISVTDSGKVNVSDTAAMLLKYARRFTKDVKLVLPTGGYLGKYQNGDSVHAKGKTLDEFLYDISTKQTAATYSLPSASTIANIGGTSSFEIGTKLNLLSAISLSKTYTRGDAGLEASPTTAVYYRGGVSLGAGVTSDASAGTLSGTDRLLTSTITYQVKNVTYTAGVQKNDNLGNPSPYSVSSPGLPASFVDGSSASITTFQYSYYGPSSTPVVSNYFRSQLQSAGKLQTLSFTGLSNEYIFYAYPTALGTLTSIKIGGFESIGAFNPSTVNLINAQGYTMPYYVYVSQNYFNGTVTGIIFQ